MLPYISYRHVYKAFGKQVVCNDFCLDVDKGKTLVLIGPSGVGKTVSIKLLVGLLEPDDGEIWFDGQDVGKLHSDADFADVRRRVSMVFQGAALFDSLSVFDNVAYPLREQGEDSDAISQKVMETLGLVGMAPFREKMPSELSGGMKKRVGLARAIVTHPETVLYDEPTAGLDPVNTTRVVQLVRLLTSRIHCTNIIVTHDIQVAIELGDVVAFIWNGQIRKKGTMDQLLNSGDPLVEGFLRAQPEAFDDLNHGGAGV